MAQTLKIKITGDASDLKRAVGDSESMIGRLGRTLGSIGKAVATAGVAVAGLGVAIPLAQLMQTLLYQTEKLVKDNGDKISAEHKARLEEARLNFDRIERLAELAAGIRHNLETMRSTGADIRRVVSIGGGTRKSLSGRHSCTSQTPANFTIASAVAKARSSASRTAAASASPGEREPPCSTRVASSPRAGSETGVRNARRVEGK